MLWRISVYPVTLELIWLWPLRLDKQRWWKLKKGKWQAPLLSNYCSTCVEFELSCVMNRRLVTFLASILSFWGSFSHLHYLCIDTVLEGLLILFSIAQIHASNLLALAKRARREHYSKARPLSGSEWMFHLLSPKHRRFEVYFQISLKNHLDAITKSLGWYIMELLCVLHMLHVASAMIYTSFSCRPSFSLKPHGS